MAFLRVNPWSWSVLLSTKLAFQAGGFLTTIMAAVLRETDLAFALWTSMISIAMWAIALGLSFVGFASTLASDRGRASRPHLGPPPIRRSRNSNANDGGGPSPPSRILRRHLSLQASITIFGAGLAPAPAN